jgi:hypothetical protein
MWDFGLMFWLVPLLFFVLVTRCRRRAGWGCATGDGSRSRREPETRELEARRDYVNSLEQRVTELEDRLDFTERLVAQRSPSAPGSFHP